MSISDCVFNVGDEVITIHGERGKITEICHCDLCRERGFFEPTWKDEYGNTSYVSIYDATEGLPDYYRIGKYRFNEFDRGYVEVCIKRIEENLDYARKRLAFMDEVEKREAENEVTQ